jgi:tetratricopeptide (TPR) repeat protein
MGLSIESEPPDSGTSTGGGPTGIALNDASPWGHATLGHIYLWQKQYDRAVSEMERVIALAPNEADGYAGLAEMLGRTGRSEEALQRVEQALRRNPSVDNFSTGVAYYLTGRPEEAIAL